MMDAASRLNDALGGRFRVGRELGQGGMATVYLADDLKHDRQVALKVLRPEVAAAVGRDRFLREIGLTAKLNHPHILPLLDSGEADGFLYYTMPVVDGGSLREWLDREQRLAVVDATRVIADVAGALDHAHRSGVVHRDLKPENILIHQGLPVLTDFGIALARTDGGRLTELGLMIGTPTYMSPEQAVGDTGIDARSDVYSLACVLFEMLTGSPPFEAPTAQAMLVRHATGEPPSLRTRRPDAPGPVVDAIVRALAKTPSDRFASAGELAGALVARPGDGQAASRAGVVVLPFTNLSPDPDDDYISDGLTEEIISALGRIRTLRVISRHSAMRLKGTDADLSALAERLHVDYVMEGSVRKHESSLRITAHLVDPRADAEAWSEHYSGSISRLFEIQERVARAVAAALDIRVTPSEERALAARPMTDPRAYECYLRARFESARWTIRSAEQAIDYLRHGVAAVGENALLEVGFGRAHFVLAHTVPGGMRQHLSEAEAHAKRAVALNPQLADVRSLVGLIHWKQQRFGAALREWTTGLSIDHDDPEALCWCTYGYATVGLTDRSVGYSERLLEVDPLNPLSRWVAAFHHLMSGEFELSLKLLDRDGERSGHSHSATAALLLLYTGHSDEAVELLERSTKAGSADTWQNLEALLLQAVRGQPIDIPDGFQEIIDLDDTYAWWVAICHAMIGEAEVAVGYLARAVELGLYNHHYLSTIDPVLTGLRSQAAFGRAMELAKERQAELV